MHRRTYLAVMIVAIILTLLVPAIPAEAKKAVGTVTGKMTCPWVDASAYTPKPGGGYLLRNYKEVCTVVADDSDPRGTGTLIAFINANLDRNFFGPIWGTYRIETRLNDGWEGTFTGQNDFPTTVMNGAAKGFGAYAGLKMRASFNLYGDGTWYSGPFTMEISS
jgi:hypothetical protein